MVTYTYKCIYILGIRIKKKIKIFESVQIPYYLIRKENE